MFRYPTLSADGHVRTPWIGRTHFVLLLMATSLLLAGEAQAQDVTPAVRRFTLTGGIGNPMGWLGAQGELYFAQERLSAFGGLGYTPEFSEGEPSGVTVAAGLRGYTEGARHRGYLELSVSQIMTVSEGEDWDGEAWIEEAGQRLYGPGLQVGYQYTALGGFTAQVSFGVGYAVTADESDLGFSPFEEWAPLMAIGFGYTWR